MQRSCCGSKVQLRLRRGSMQQSCVQSPTGVLSPLCYVIEPTGRFRNEMEKESVAGKENAKALIIRAFALSGRHYYSA